MRRDFDPTDPFHRISQAVKEMRSLHEFYESAFQIGGFGPWEQLDDDLLYFTPAWQRLFGLKKTPVTLEEYLALIDDPAERERVQTARQDLQFLAYGNHWSDTFILAGQRIRSVCLTTKSGRLIGVDSIFIALPTCQ